LVKSTTVNSLAKRRSINRELKDEIEEFRTLYDDVISSADLRTLRTVKRLLTVRTVLTPGDYRALRPISGQFMWGAFNLMQRYRFLRENPTKKMQRLLLKMMMTFSVRDTIIGKN